LVTPAPEAASKVISFPGPAKKEKNPAAVALGKLGGSKGGRKRAENLSPERRKEIAKKAAQERWKRETRPNGPPG
jgi:hypothetical protein